MCNRQGHKTRILKLNSSNAVPDNFMAFEEEILCKLIQFVLFPLISSQFKLPNILGHGFQVVVSYPQMRAGLFVHLMTLFTCSETNNLNKNKR